MSLTSKGQISLESSKGCIYKVVVIYKWVLFTEKKIHIFLKYFDLVNGASCSLGCVTESFRLCWVNYLSFVELGLGAGEVLDSDLH